MNRITRRLSAIFPILVWGRGYNQLDLRADVVAGSIVLFITVPQVIAYAFLAGMPPETGLYAALFALIGYAFFGSSKTLSVGPTAIIAMMTLEIASLHAQQVGSDYRQIVVQLSVLTGLILIAMRLINFGSAVSFVSHAVVTGFISAAAILIIGNQVAAILGLRPSVDTSIVGIIKHIFIDLSVINFVVVLIALSALSLLVICRTWLGGLLFRIGVSESLTDGLVKSAPMCVVLMGILISQIFGLDGTVPIVGEIPRSLPDVSVPWISFDMIKTLGPSAFLIALVVFLESISIGTALASKSRDSIDANQELTGVGFANIASSMVGSFPVAGSFARSTVNFSSGAVTPVASLITAILILLTIFFFAPLFYGLPKGVLAAIIVVSAWQLLDFAAARKIFGFSVPDAVTFSGTFVAVLAFGVEAGVLTGVLISFVLLIRNSSTPNIALVGRVGDSEHFRNIERYEVSTSPKVMAIRVDESFYFVNARFIETFVLNQLAARTEVEHILFICTATNFIDTSGLEMLERLSENLYETGITLHLAEVKGPVMDKLKKTTFCQNMRGQLFFTANVAMRELAGI